MRKLIPVLLIVSFHGMAQTCNISLKDDEYSFEEIVTLEKLDPQEGYSNFLVNYVPSLQPASQLIWAPNVKNGVITTNEEARIITISHSFDYPGKNYRCVIYRMKIEFKENRYKYRISTITISYATAVSGMTNESLEQFLQKENDKKITSTLSFINEKIDLEIQKMKKAILKSDKW